MFTAQEPRHVRAREHDQQGVAPTKSVKVQKNGKIELEGATKIGVKSGDPNRHSQPRLPGSVVGEASMRGEEIPGKITEVTAPK
jgi:hypothetical protein